MDGKIYALVSIALKCGEDVTQIAQELAKNPEVDRIFTTPYGEYNLVVVLYGQDEELNKFIVVNIRQIPGYDMSHTIMPVSKIQAVVKTGLGGFKSERL